MRATKKRVPPPRVARAAQWQLEKGLREMEEVTADIRRGLARAERRIETDARRRIRALQKEGRAQMRALEAKRREATRLLGKLSAAAEGSWEDLARTLQAMVADARAGAAAVIERFRNVLS